MNLLTTILAHAEEPAPLILPIWAFPLIAVLFFVVIALVTFSHRDVANRHSDKLLRGARGHDEHGAGH